MQQLVASSVFKSDRDSHAYMSCCVRIKSNKYIDGYWHSRYQWNMWQNRCNYTKILIDIAKSLRTVGKYGCIQWIIKSTWDYAKNFNDSKCYKMDLCQISPHISTQIVWRSHWYKTNQASRFFQLLSLIDVDAQNVHNVQVYWLPVRTFWECMNIIWLFP